MEVEEAGRRPARDEPAPATDGAADEPPRAPLDVPVDRERRVAPDPLGDVAAGTGGADAAADAVDDAICDLVADPYLRTDARGIVRLANGGATALLGRSLVWLRGRPIFGWVAEDQQRMLRSLLAGLAEASGARQLTLRLRIADGSTVAVTATVAPVRDAAGALVGARFVLRPAGSGAADEPRPAAGAASGPLPSESTRFYADFLARVTTHLGASLDLDVMLRGLAHAAVPVVADWCLVDVVEVDGALRRVAVAHAAGEDPVPGAPVPASSSLADAADPVGAALRSRRPQLAAASDAAHAGVPGDARPRSWLAVPLVARGQALGVVSFAMASSRRTFTPLLVAVAEELARRTALSADNARLYRQAVRASEAKSAFLGTISHELRTPLTAIIGYAELLHDGLAGPLAERQSEFVRRIRESSDHLLRLVEEVLGFARLQAREEHATIDEVDVAQLAEQSLALVAPEAQRKGLSLALDLPPGGCRIVSDATKIRQVLVNLLGNAVKFTERGGVRLHVAPTVTPAPGVRLEVSDTGIGIDAAQLPHVFDPFWQAEQSATRSRGGAGLGLSVVKQLAQLLGGDVTVSSERGVGSRFDVWLPSRVEPRAHVADPRGGA